MLKTCHCFFHLVFFLMILETGGLYYDILINVPNCVVGKHAYMFIKCGVTGHSIIIASSLLPGKWP